MGSPFQYEVQLRWSDEDRLGHINNTRYLTFAEDARLAWFAKMPGRNDDGGGGGAILARLECDFIAQGHADPGSRVVTVNSVQRVGRSSLDLGQQIVDGSGTTIASVKAVLVAFDYQANSSRPWSDEQLAWIEDFRSDK